ncbi:hypothetical protein NYQ35_15995 [Curtobacterium flaccumfaciens pv. flaccumfaciens]|uniref:hypothetical protein n=1 Tax=Curtobacterium flaccumfaciens TaxID=2035 RepID=UPI00217DE6C5|nr:hypothetical protein [Curtobacterium flaccumfaciens]MCS6570308.1 hypothetical protein [Curtobacterium flaccumfaciens pv. flaccumfaciens]MCS6585164.1 hypothetical protein [Curtobacterium flaccumfaciens pv. flaccumfaciens]
MTADTTPTPNELLTRIAEASRTGRVEELRSIVNELPVPPRPKSRLRVILLDDLDAAVTHGDDSAWWDDDKLDALSQKWEERPEPMTVIERAVHEWYSPGEQDVAAALVDSIRTALEVATQ